MWIKCSLIQVYARFSSEDLSTDFDKKMHRNNKLKFYGDFNWILETMKKL